MAKANLQDAPPPKETLVKMVRVSRRLLQELGREPTDQQIGDQMGISAEEVREIVHLAQGGPGWLGQ